MKRLDAMKGRAVGTEAWAENVVIPTYAVRPPDKNPMFLEKRVYQGSSGRVYPLPFYDGVTKECDDLPYEALHLENEYIYLMMLPEIGGRIHIGYDKKAGYDFFYRQNVIKPALVGLAGPWISGGVEFNWPQHHRPSTFMSTEWTLEEHEDGSKTFWMSEHEPMNRMKGMHGVCIRPGSSLIELKARLFNRTPHVQTFLWWANVAARVHEQYQSFFPPDVRFIADHAKRATSTFPGCLDTYYGVRYGERALNGVPADKAPSRFVPGGGYAPNRLDWYANIPVPTSYMVVSTDYGFFGGYDHEADAGFVHVADRHVSPGKKQWTWGNHEFGYAWDRNLTDEGGPYVELMAGVYTDNQPDFSFLMPYETKTFSQYWYPICGIGPASNATKEAAVSLVGNRVGVCPSSTYAGVRLVVEFEGATAEKTIDIAPDSPYLETFDKKPVAVRVLSAEGDMLVEFDSRTDADQPEPESATEPPLPSEVESQHELYTIGLHLDQYRHATRMPEPYWEEAIRRDPCDARCHTALAKRLIGRGLYREAEEHLHQAVQGLTQRNPNPYDGEAYYQLGLVLELQEIYSEAMKAHGKAAWNYEWKAASQIGMARLHSREGRFSQALDCLKQAQIGAGDANTIFTMRAAILRNQNKKEEARREAAKVLEYDRLDIWARFETQGEVPEGVQDKIDLALELKSCGFEDDATKILKKEEDRHPIVNLLLGKRADEADPIQGLFPNRLGELKALERGVIRNSDDAEAKALLGFLYYDRKRYDDAIEQWEAAVNTNPSHAIVWRCLGIGYFNVRKDAEKARAAYERAVEANPNDARLVYERDQLWKRIGVSPKERLTELLKHPKAVEDRDDLTLELASLYCLTDQPEQAIERLEARDFAPWEGGEGIALGLHSRSHALLAAKLLKQGHSQEAVNEAKVALDTPANLGEARHLLSNCSDLWFLLGETLKANGNEQEAAEYYRKAANFRGDFQEMSVKRFSEKTYFQAMSHRRLDKDVEATQQLKELLQYSKGLEQEEAKIDYFATSLPTMLLFDDDLQERQTTAALFMQAQALYGLGNTNEARKLVDKVIQRDPNHAMAQDLLSEMSVL